MASRHTGRKWAVGIVISVDAILLTLANGAFWACFTLLNTPGWVAIVGPLSKDQAVTELILTDAFDNVWVPLNRTGHRTVMDVRKGKRDRLYFQEGNLTLDFSDLYNYVEDRLGIVECLDRAGNDRQSATDWLS